MRFRGVRPQLQSLAKLADRFFQLSLGCQGSAQVVMCFNVRRIELQGLTILCDGFIQPALRCECQAQVVVGFDKGWVELQGLAILSDCRKQVMASSSLP